MQNWKKKSCTEPPRRNRSGSNDNDSDNDDYSDEEEEAETKLKERINGFKILRGIFTILIFSDCEFHSLLYNHLSNILLSLSIVQNDRLMDYIRDKCYWYESKHCHNEQSMKLWTKIISILMLPKRRPDPSKFKKYWDILMPLIWLRESKWIENEFIPKLGTQLAFEFATQISKQLLQRMNQTHFENKQQNEMKIPNFYVKFVTNQLGMNWKLTNDTDNDNNDDNSENMSMMNHNSYNNDD